MNNTEALELIERAMAAKPEGDIWESAFCDACALLASAPKSLTPGELARVLRWLDQHDCYYHAEICDLKHAALGEAASRIGGTDHGVLLWGSLPDARKGGFW